MVTLIECRGIVKQYGSRAVLRRIDWEIAQGCVTGLLGESGAGKTTLLRLLARLERPTAGSLYTQTDSLQVAMVFQSLALWPHLTAFEHVSYVLPAQSRTDARQACEALLREVRLPEHLWQSKPDQLSGGEAQRLALARALAPGPDLLLLDEPFAQLDMALRHDLAELIHSLVEQRGLSVVCVSHSWLDIARFCEQVAVLHHGVVVQQGSWAKVYGHPANVQVANMTGPVVAIAEELIDTGKIHVEGTLETLHGEEGHNLLVRPQQIRIGPPSERNCWRVEQVEIDYAGWKYTLLDCAADETSRQPVKLTTAAYAPLNELVSIHVVEMP